MYKIEELTTCAISKLTAIAEELAVTDFASIDKQTLIYKILDAQALQNPAPTQATKPKQEEGRHPPREQRA